MKKITLLTLLVISSISIFAQGIVDKYYADLEAQEKTTSVFVSSAMFEMAAKLDIESDDEEFNEMKSFINNVKSFSLIKVPELMNPVSYFKEGIRKIEDSHEELVRVKDEDTRIRVFIHEENDVIYEVAVLGVVDGEFLAASLVGEMDLNMISKFVNKMQGESFDGLSKLKDLGAAEMKVYPNPSSRGTEITVAIPASLEGATAIFQDMEGKVIKTIPTSGDYLIVNTQDFPTGGYVVELQKDGASVTQKMIVLD